MQIPHWPKIPLWRSNYKLDLSNIKKLLLALNNPEQNLPPIIHIAGTNGKGSSVAMLKAIYTAAGYKVHSYTSPHLLEFNERINLAGENISDYYLVDILERTRIAAEKNNVESTFFEGTTAAAFLAFAENKADLLLLETGLGGRLDCTNVIQNPALTFITPISFDHMNYLGTSLEQIAAEKAGIIKPNVPCIISMQQDIVCKVLLNQCNQIGAPAFCYEYDYMIKKRDNGFTYKSLKYTINIPSLSLQGDHQLINAGAVISAVTLLNKIPFNKAKQLLVTKDQIKRGLLNTTWPGRIEKIKKNKYKHLVAHDNIQIYLDGAHNPAGALVLSEWIKTNLTDPTYIIIGLTKNRDAPSFCQYFQNIVKEGRTVKVLSEPSGYNAEILKEKLSSIPINFIASNSLEEAIYSLSRLNNTTPINIIITGSLFLLSDFYKLV